MMTPTQALVIGLALWGAVATGCAFKYKADAREAGADGEVAQVHTDVATRDAANAAGISNANMMARQECEAEMARVGGENASALAMAQADAATARGQAQLYYDLLYGGDKSAACQAFVDSKICPELLDY